MHGTSPEKSGDAEAAPQLSEVFIDEETWSSATKERRREWRVVLDDLIAEHRFGAALPDRMSMQITLRGGRILFEVWPFDATEDAKDDEAIRDAIALADLEPHLREYFKICIDMSQLDVGPSSPKLEALDMAKRLAHNDAAKTAQRLFVALRPDHPTARRLFTLIVTLHFDTTRLLRPHHLDATLQSRSLRERGADEP